MSDNTDTAATQAAQGNQPSAQTNEEFNEEEEEDASLFVPTQDELDELEEKNKDKGKRFVLTQALGMMPVAHDRKVLLASREKMKEVIPLLDSTNREIRVGALAALIENVRQDTMVSKKDIKLLILRLQPKERPIVQTSKVKKSTKEDSAAVKAVKAKYPNADQRGKDSPYAAEIRIARQKA
jgi:hypothetical protein